MSLNRVKEQMLAGRPALGLAATFGSPLAAEILAQAGCDYVIIDDQHGLWEPASMQAGFRSVWAAGAVPMGRARCNDFGVIGAMLDRGALGIIVPMVDTPEQAHEAVRATRYPPLGRRSEGPYGCRIYGPAYRDQANEDILLAVQIESAEAVQRAEEILSVEGVDGCWIGPGDLANTMGINLRKGERAEEHQAAIMRVLEACRRTGKIPGLWTVGDPKDWIERGFLFVTPSGDSRLLDQSASETLRRLRG